MKATTKVAFNHDELGKIAVGDFEVTPAQANALRGLGWITIHDSKKLETKPERAAKIETKPEPAKATDRKKKAKAK